MSEISEQEFKDLRERVTRAEMALDEIFPGWRHGAHAPGCKCGSCVN